MTISPIGSPIPPPNTPEERVNGNSKQAEPVANAERHSETEKVDISPGARRVIDRQADVTRLQVADKAAENYQKEVRAVQQLFEKHQEPGREIAPEVRERIEEHVRTARDAMDNARFSDENLFDGRELRVRVEENLESLRMPDSRRESDSFEKVVRAALKERRRPVTSKNTGWVEQFRNRLQNMVKRLETQTRASIETAVKESTANQPRDVADAENAILRARVTPVRQRSPNMEKISQRAVDLLQ